jgi:2-polyprenyl-6-methoxyphenol hydroxylase-like FAD-dependent oxidoreductase
VYRLNITNEWYRWHGAAVLRLGKTFPLEPLARVREAYHTQEVPAEQQLQQLLQTVPWRLQRAQEQQEREERRAAKKAMIGFKMDQRRRQNIADAAKKKEKSDGQGATVGMGLKGPGGKDNWRRRKLKPPGTLGRKF